MGVTLKNSKILEGMCWKLKLLLAAEKEWKIRLLHLVNLVIPEKVE